MSFNWEEAGIPEKQPPPPGDLNQEPSSCEATLLTTAATPCLKEMPFILVQNQPF